MIPQKPVRFLIFCFLVLPLFNIAAEPSGKKKPAGVADSLQHLYPFLKTDSNRISGNPDSLMPFIQKLERIANGSTEQAVVVHIGDSHVQPGFITAPLREFLQQRYHNAGRGLIFPYRVAKSNGPDGYISRTETPWNSCRIASRKQFCSSGISGFTIWSDQYDPSFIFEFKDMNLYGEGINRLTIFHGSRDTTRNFTILNLADSGYMKPIDSLHEYYTVFVTARQPESVNIQTLPGDPVRKSAVFYGMSVQGSEPGVVVHTIGVNGAMFADYLHSSLLTDQLSVLKPDLLIFSLGTNEAVNAKYYTSDSLYRVMDSLTSTIRQKGITATLMFTTPPAIYKGFRKNRRTVYKPNPNAEQVRNTIVRYATERNLPCWDWFMIMGGPNSMAKWKSKKMTDRRYIHFNPKGYTIQGTLLREAFVKIMEKKK